jgi:hypothetical protein
MRLVTTSGRRLANALYNVRQRLAFGCSRNITGSNCVMLQMIVKLLPYSITFFSSEIQITEKWSEALFTHLRSNHTNLKQDPHKRRKKAEVNLHYKHLNMEWNKAARRKPRKT